MEQQLKTAEETPMKDKQKHRSFPGLLKGLTLNIFGSMDNVKVLMHLWDKCPKQRCRENKVTNKNEECSGRALNTDLSWLGEKEIPQKV